MFKLCTVLVCEFFKFLTNDISFQFAFPSQHFDLRTYSLDCIVCLLTSIPKSILFRPDVLPMNLE